MRHRRFEAGAPLSARSGYAEADPIPARGTSPFSIDLFDDSPRPLYASGHLPRPPIRGAMT